MRGEARLERRQVLESLMLPHSPNSSEKPIRPLMVVLKQGLPAAAYLANRFIDCMSPFEIMNKSCEYDGFMSSPNM